MRWIVLITESAVWGTRWIEQVEKLERFSSEKTKRNPEKSGDQNKPKSRTEIGFEVSGSDRSGSERLRSIKTNRKWSSHLIKVRSIRPNQLEGVSRAQENWLNFTRSTLTKRFLQSLGPTRLFTGLFDEHSSTESFTEESYEKSLLLLRLSGSIVRCDYVKKHFGG